MELLSARYAVASASETMKIIGTAAGNSERTAQPQNTPAIHASRWIRAGAVQRAIATAALNAIIRHPAVTPWPWKSVA